MAVRCSGAERQKIKIYRAQAYKRQRGRCFWCDEFVRREDATADHLQERRNGGLTARGNIVMACQPCNNDRSNAPPEHHEHIKIWRRVRWREMNIEVHAESIGA